VEFFYIENPNKYYINISPKINIFVINNFGTIIMIFRTFKNIFIYIFK
jgi:hypothetical protein